MMKSLFSPFFLVVAASVVLGPFGAFAEERKTSYNWERFREIAERNIFSRGRTAFIRGSSGADAGRFDRAAEAEAARARMSGPDDPGRHLILTGVSKIGARYYAFFENTRDNTISSAAAGDTVANRKITTITLDKVEYVAGEKPVTISVGRTLTGDKVETASSGSAPGQGFGPGQGFSRGPGSRGPGSDRGSGFQRGSGFPGGPERSDGPGSRTGGEAPAVPAASPAPGPAEEAKPESKTSESPEDVLERLRRRRQEEASK
jgi:hypothetical protein